MSYPLTMAKKNSYGGTRNLSSIKYIVLHYTGVNHDSAKNEVKFFATGNTRSAGAHFFVGQDGDIQQSIPLKYIAWSVGDYRNGKGAYYGKCTNSNSVSIEMCDQLYKDASADQINAVRNVIKYIKTLCPNIIDVIRHYDVTTKHCPARYLTNDKWRKLKSAVTDGTYTEPVKISDSSEPLAVDGYIGQKTVRRWQEIMHTPHDGEISKQLKSLKKYHLRFTSNCIEYVTSDDKKEGSKLIRKVQEMVGFTGNDVDGQMGSKTIKAIQTRIGVYPDGYFGEQTAKALQARLNTGAF